MPVSMGTSLESSVKIQAVFGTCGRWLLLLGISGTRIGTEALECIGVSCVRWSCNLHIRGESAATFSLFPALVKCLSVVKSFGWRTTGLK